MNRKIIYIAGIIMGCIITAGGGYLIYQCYKGLDEYFTYNRGHNVPSAILAAAVALLAFFIASLLFIPDNAYRRKYVRVLAIIFGFIFGITGLLAVIIFGLIFFHLFTSANFSTISANFAVIAGIIAVVTGITSFIFFKRGFQKKQIRELRVNNQSADTVQ